MNEKAAGIIATVIQVLQERIMCRSIKPLRLPDRPATEEEIREAALQYVRKVSGYRKPSRANQEAFQTAVEDVASATRRMLETLSMKETA
jgi:hypothetical protein